MSPRGVLLDLDGVVYTGGHPVPGAVEAVRAWTQRGVPVGFVTNNASAATQAVADKLGGFGLDIDADQVTTSGQAAAAEVAAQLPAGSRVLVVGSPALVDLTAEAGLQPVTPRSDDELPAVDAVIQGFDRSADWHSFAAAIRAVRAGARYWATNPDRSVPTEYGLLPGNGTFVRIVADFSGVEPTIVGKPAGAALLQTAERLSMESPTMVGDRTETDIAAAHAAGFPSALVLTGIDDVHSALRAPRDQRPETVIADLRELDDTLPAVHLDGNTARCGQAAARIDNDRVEISGPPRAAVQAALTLTQDRESLDLSALPRRFDAAAR